MTRIITNYHKRPLVYRWEIPPAIIESDFDYTTDDSLFFKYRGSWYCLDDFPVFEGPWSPYTPDWAQGWHAFSADSFFSGVIVRLTDDHESIVVGLVLS